MIPIGSLVTSTYAYYQYILISKNSVLVTLSDSELHIPGRVYPIYEDDLVKIFSIFIIATTTYDMGN